MSRLIHAVACGYMSVCVCVPRRRSSEMSTADDMSVVSSEEAVPRETDTKRRDEEEEEASRGREVAQHVARIRNMAIAEIIDELVKSNHYFAPLEEQVWTDWCQYVVQSRLDKDYRTKLAAAARDPTLASNAVARRMVQNIRKVEKGQTGVWEALKEWSATKDPQVGHLFAAARFCMSMRVGELPPDADQQGGKLACALTGVRDPRRLRTVYFLANQKECEAYDACLQQRKMDRLDAYRKEHAAEVQIFERLNQMAFHPSKVEAPQELPQKALTGSGGWVVDAGVLPVINQVIVLFHVTAAMILSTKTWFDRIHSSLPHLKDFDTHVRLLTQDESVFPTQSMRQIQVGMENARWVLLAFTRDEHINRRIIELVKEKVPPELQRAAERAAYQLRSPAVLKSSQGPVKPRRPLPTFQPDVKEMESADEKE